VKRIRILEYRDKDAYEYKRLRALGYRADRNVGFGKIATCVNRLRLGEKPYQLYGAAAKDAIVSQDLGLKIGRDYQDGKLDFITQFPADENERARYDPFRITRYDIVKEAEEMAPHSQWTIGHIKGLGMSRDEAVELLQKYDRIRETRIEAEVTLTSFEHEVKDGKTVVVPTSEGKAMRNFRDLPEYLRLLYSMYYLTTYPEAFDLNLVWAARAADIRARGKLVEKDDRLVVAADNIYRYEIWDQENLDSYFQGLARLSKTEVSHGKFVKDLKRRFMKGSYVSNG
jgi:hypothetical protein